MLEVPVGVLVAATQAEPFHVCHVAMVFQLPLAALRKSPVPLLITIDELVPVLPLPSVAVMVTVSATFPFVLMVHAPLESILVLLLNELSPRPSNNTFPVL